ncbi:MAG: Gfo/Idh/MocA family oxidoreductase [Candidatus Latescibacteria bacterium]|nr:Gfo/Idh/MocA family oxidoreductase [Candidatus Latescibacterota bacterium]
MEKLKIGILGLGRGSGHLKNFLNLEEAEVIGAADRFEMRRERAEEHIASVGAKTWVVPEFEDLLEMKPDAIVVSTNGKQQVEHSIQAMRAGCHVLSEIPGGYTEEEAVRLRDAVELHNKTYMLAENSCFYDFLRYWRKWIVEDRFGPISIAEAEYIHYLPYTLVAPNGGRMKPSKAREEGRTDFTPLWRADQPPIQYLTHDLGPLLEVLDDRCVSVTCRSAPWRCPETPLRSDGQIALFTTEKGTLIKILVTLSTRRPGEHRYRIFGTEGGAEFFGYEGRCRRLDRDRDEKEGWEVLPIGTSAPDDDPSTGHGGTDAKIGQFFINAVLKGEPPPIDVYRGIEYFLPGIVANRSAELGGTPIGLPDLRRDPFGTTRFWDAVGLPESDPEPVTQEP